MNENVTLLTMMTGAARCKRRDQLPDEPVPPSEVGMRMVLRWGQVTQRKNYSPGRKGSHPAAALECGEHRRFGFSFCGVRRASPLWFFLSRPNTRGSFRFAAPKKEPKRRCS